MDKGRNAYLVLPRYFTSSKNLQMTKYYILLAEKSVNSCLIDYTINYLPTQYTLHFLPDISFAMKIIKQLPNSIF